MKKKDIYHECACAGQRMTREEWWQWLQGHQSNEVVHRCGEFGYNIYDVCVNPHLIIDFSDKYKNRFGVETCQADNGKWGYGVSYRLGTHGGCHAATFTNATHDTEKAAAYAALQEIDLKCSRVIDEIERYGEMPDNEDEEKPRNSSYLPKLEAIKNKIEAYKQQYNPMVLNLFGW